MSKYKRTRGVQLDRIEAAYLGILRVGVLSVATICILVAIYFAADAAWRVFVSTKVDTEPTTVSASEVALALKKPVASRQINGARSIPDGVKKAHAAFVGGAFNQYYEVYRAASEAYKKPEDKTISKADLLDQLGYDLGTYASGNSMRVKLFVENVDYQTQALSAVKGAMSDPGVVSQLREYKAAQKTAQQCSTVYEPRNVWDSNSTDCSGWFYNPVGCRVTRNVPVERCVAAYPAGIVSPRVAFDRADSVFSSTWAEKSERSASAARYKEMERQELRDGIGPRLMMALKVVAAFLVIMFFFLLVAIERHLRRVAAGNRPQESVEAVPDKSDKNLDA